MIEFIIGPARSGKTRRCYEEIKKQLKQKEFNHLIMVVPEQFNLQVQSELAHLFSPGLLRIEVMSFNNLADKVLGEIGGNHEPMIDDLERVMILKKVIEEHKKELQYFAKSSYNEGFLDNINQLITVFEQNSIDVQLLEDLKQTEGISSVFKYKMADFSNIYSWFNTYISNRFLTVEKTMERLAKSISNSQYLEDTIVWIDGFYGFTRPQTMIITAMMKKVRHLVLTLPMNEKYEADTFILPNNPFYDSIINYQRLLHICGEEQLKSVVTYLKGYSTQEIDALDYLEKNYLKPYSPKYDLQNTQIELSSYTNKEEEITAVAKHIQVLVREQGYRYNDIAILVGDLNDYRLSLSGVFKEYEIPTFIDDKKSIQTNSLVAVIQASLDVLLTGFSYKSIMTLLRLNMFNFRRDDIDLLENYLLENGIKGLKRWEVVWERESKQVSLEFVNTMRVAILEWILPLKQKIDEIKDQKGHMSIRQATICIYDFLEQIQAYEQIEQRIQYYQQINEVTLERENTQIWGLVMEVFERLVELLGEERLSITAYRNLLKTSFSYVKMGIIPPTQDQVIIGTVDRTRIPQIKAVFILGVNEGVVPKVDEGNSLFSDMDRAILGEICESKDRTKDIGKERLNHALVNQPIYSGQFLVYSVLTRATEKLIVSTYQADDIGKTQRPSLVYYKLKKMFGEKGQSEEVLEQIQNPNATLGYIGKQLRNYLEGVELAAHENIFKDTLSWYIEQPLWSERIKALTKDIGYKQYQEYLKPENAKLLYPDDLETSISKLESYRNCPCCYFIKYGIKASERKLLEWNTADLGTLFHATLERYPKELEIIGKKWREASQEEITACVHKAVEYSVTHSTYANKHEARIQYTIKRVQEMSTRAIKALTHQLQQGEFEPEAYEVTFGGEGFPPIEIQLEDETKVLLKGQIDRVDVYVKDKDTRYIKVLDYKTSQKNFDLSEVYHSLQLQLLLYLDAYLRLNPTNKVAGMFYFHIDTKKIKYELGMNTQDALAKQLQQFRLSGLALAEKEVVELLEHGIKGEVIPAKLKKDESFSSASSVATEQQFNDLREHMIGAIKKLSSEILKGRIAAKPCKIKEKDACAYCKYKSICQFDENSLENSYERLEDLKPKEVWERIHTEVRGEEV